MTMGRFIGRPWRARTEPLPPSSVVSKALRHLPPIIRVMRFRQQRQRVAVRALPLYPAPLALFAAVYITLGRLAGDVCD